MMIQRNVVHLLNVAICEYRSDFPKLCDFALLVLSLFNILPAYVLARTLGTRVSTLSVDRSFVSQ